MVPALQGGAARAVMATVPARQTGPFVKALAAISCEDSVKTIFYRFRATSHFPRDCHPLCPPSTRRTRFLFCVKRAVGAKRSRSTRR